MSPAVLFSPQPLLLLVALFLAQVTLWGGEEDELDVDALLEQWLREEDPDDPGIPELDKVLAPVSPWSFQTSLSTGGGYRDNVNFSSFSRDDGGFLLGGLESSLMRLPGDGVEFSILLDVEHLDFLSRHGYPDDTFASMVVQTRAPVTPISALTFSLLSFYYDQVVDPSTLHEQFDPQPISGWGAQVRPGFQTNWGEDLFTEVSFLGSRHEMSGKFSDYWEAGPKLEIGRQDGGSRLSFAIEVLRTDFDDRLPRTAEGEELPGLDLRFRRIKPELSFRHELDRRARWISHTRAGIEPLRDNRTGYFDYDRLRLSQRITFRTDLWEVSGFLSYSDYDYRVQRVPGGEKRERESLGAEAEIRRKLHKRAEFFLRYERQKVRSNEQDADYSVNTYASGLNWRF